MFSETMWLREYSFRIAHKFGSDDMSDSEFRADNDGLSDVHIVRSTAQGTIVVHFL